MMFLNWEWPAKGASRNRRDANFAAGVIGRCPGKIQNAEPWIVVA
jgi:hypothetical protein